jgi:hypothetical protein
VSYDECRRHLDPVRAHLETLKVLHISTAYMSTRKGEPSAIFNLDAEYLGAYLRDDKLVVMMKFDDKKIDYTYLDVAYYGIRERTKKILVNTFPGLSEKDLAIYVIDSSGDLVDIEFV